MNRLLVVITLLSVSATASAGPILLGSFGGYVGSGGTELTDPRVQMGIRVRSVDFPHESIDLRDILFSREFLSDGGSGAFVFEAETDPLFRPFADLFTNGVDDYINLFSVWGKMKHVGIRGDSESFFLGRDTTIGQLPDFSGYRLDSIRLLITDLRIDPFVLNEQNGLMARFYYDYEFYGYPVPEPGTCVLLALGSFVFWRRKPRRLVPLPFKIGSIK